MKEQEFVQGLEKGKEKVSSRPSVQKKTRTDKIYFSV